MPKFDIRRNVKQNRDNILAILSNTSIWMNYNQWVKSQLLKENEKLFPKDPKYLYYSKEQKMRKNCLATSFNYINTNITTETIDNYQIRTIHQLISAGSDINGGAIRLTEADLQSLNITTPDTAVIYHRMDELQYYLSRTDIDPITKAFQAHYDIVSIQPFEDLNKRTARMIMNWILMKDGFTPLLFNHNGDRELYIDAIKNKNTGSRKEYEKTFLSTLMRTQHRVLEFLYKTQRINGNQ
ncbi:MAG: Fic family protein [Rickettsiales bacterium]|jgi:Fic family protein|nr:Fic family protein [Rickettsiales bacterium]